MKKYIIIDVTTVSKFTINENMKEYYHKHNEKKKEYYDKNKEHKKNMEVITLEIFLKKKRKRKKNTVKYFRNLKSK